MILIAFLYISLSFSFDYFIKSNFYITMQHRLDRVLSLTTSLVTPLNLVIDWFGPVVRISFVVTDNNDISIGDEPLFLGKFGIALHWLFVDVILGGAPINEPFSSVPLFRDWARCFFKLANVVPACDWLVSIDNSLFCCRFSQIFSFFGYFLQPRMEFIYYRNVRALQTGKELIFRSHGVSNMFSIWRRFVDIEKMKIERR